MLAADGSRKKIVNIPVAKVPSGDPITYCRLCFSERISTRVTTRESALNWIQYIGENGGIQMDIAVDYRFALCIGCTTALESVGQFRATCQKHDLALKQHRASLRMPQTNQIVISNVVTLAVDANPTKKAVAPQKEAINGDQPSGEGMRKCYACDLEIPEESFMKHMKKFHIVKGSFLHCSFCPKKFRKTDLYQKHLQRHKTRNDKSRSYKWVYSETNCNVCKKIFKDSTELGQHEIEEHGLKFQCRDCLRRFSSLKDKLVHKMLHKAATPTANYRCNICYRYFTTRQNLNIHSRRHVRHFICPVCGTVCPDLEHLVEHQNAVHPTNANQQIDCTPCQMIFANNEDLWAHLTSSHTTVSNQQLSDSDEDVEEEPSDAQLPTQSTEANVETVSLSDDDMNDDLECEDDDLFPTYLDGEEDAQDVGAEEAGMSQEPADFATGNELEDELILSEAQQAPDAGFDLYGTAFPQQITITLDDTNSQ